MKGQLLATLDLTGDQCAGAAGITGALKKASAM